MSFIVLFQLTFIFIYSIFIKKNSISAKQVNTKQTLVKKCEIFCISRIVPYAYYASFIL